MVNAMGAEIAELGECNTVLNRVIKLGLFQEQKLKRWKIYPYQYLGKEHSRQKK